MSMTCREPIVVGAPETSADGWGRSLASGVSHVGGTTQRIHAGRSLLRVLVVDDNRDAADSLSMLVETWGHAVRRAYGGAAALEIASAYRPHALLLDVAMPKLDGCQLARLLRGQACFTQALLIAITGYADETHHLLCMEAGFDQWLVKPVEPSIVERLLQLEKDRLAESGKRLAHARAGNQPGRHTPDLEQNQAEDRWRDDGGQG